ncbi:MAG: hypothetical protein KA989_03805, partial [Phascolarctobacterium sp.]|nr:hypothetical protein [Phascolarctobacterium sp.]
VTPRAIAIASTKDFFMINSSSLSKVFFYLAEACAACSQNLPCFILGFALLAPFGKAGKARRINCFSFASGCSISNF